MTTKKSVNLKSKKTLGIILVGGVVLGGIIYGITRNSKRDLGILFVAAPSGSLGYTFTPYAIGGVAPYTAAWDFGDGQTSTESKPTHTYLTAGTYNVELTVTDSTGKTATATHGLNLTSNGNAVLTSPTGEIVSYIPTVFKTEPVTPLDERLAKLGITYTNTSVTWKGVTYSLRQQPLPYPIVPTARNPFWGNLTMAQIKADCAVAGENWNMLPEELRNIIAEAQQEMYQDYAATQTSALGG